MDEMTDREPYSWARDEDSGHPNDPCWVYRNAQPA